ncbi:MAG: putative iron-sulfur-binding reductase [Deltaproteobacteria bacterium]|nr:putative iron-sulfur-binding reductase [Deltaproteobacteria bacterium]
MDVGREIMWNVGHTGQFVSYAFLIITAIVMILGLKKRYAMWKMGKPAPIQFTKRLGERIGYFITNGIFHKSILREAFPGWMHFLIFWGFLVLTVGTALVAIQADFTDLFFKVKFLKGGFYLIFSFLLELGGLAAIIGILMAIYRRYVVKPDRLDTKPDDGIVLAWILVVLVTGFLAEGARIAAFMNDPAYAYEKWSFLGWIAGYIFVGMPAESIKSTHMAMWYIHMVLSFGFLAYIVYSRMLHLITSSLNMMFRGIEDVPEGARGALQPIEDFENAEEFGNNQIDGFTWRQMFDLDACTRCGRCQDLCPAYNTEKPLTPKGFIQDLKGEWERVGKGGAKNEDGLIDTVIQEQTLWSCTMCLACQVNCPVSIPTVDKNIEMRRYLTLTLSKTTSDTKLLFKNIQKNSNPYGMGKKERLGWTEGLDIRNAAEQEVDYLYWVGCVASLDDRNRKVARSFATLLNKAGVNFGILGTDEMCCGDPSRRCGNEEQYLGTAQGNVEMLNEIGIKKIITTCPHCYTTIKKEYAQLGGNFEVYHQGEFLAKLMSEGKLQINPAVEGKITFHDPCYLGRANGIFDGPRSLVKKAAKGTYEEMGRNHDRSFCCGGGGGGMWMEEHHKRINHARIDEAIAIQASTVVTACPYCLIMMEDAIKDKEKVETMKAMDLSELIVKGFE